MPPGETVYKPRPQCRLRMRTMHSPFIDDVTFQFRSQRAAIVCSSCFTTPSKHEPSSMQQRPNLLCSTTHFWIKRVKANEFYIMLPSFPWQTHNKTDPAASWGDRREGSVMASLPRVEEGHYTQTVYGMVGAPLALSQSSVGILPCGYARSKVG